MQLSALFGTAFILASSIQACVRIHTVSRNNPLFGDGMRVQIWDNDDFYEVQSQSVGSFKASGDKHWYFTFGNGHHVDVWDNGRSAHLALDNGWTADFQRANSKTSSDCVIDGENGCKTHDLTTESCLMDGFGNCGGYTCGLCDEEDCGR